MDNRGIAEFLQPCARVEVGGAAIASRSCPHLRRASAGAEYAVVHIVRFETGKIMEWCNVAQELPAASPNASGPF